MKIGIDGNIERDRKDCPFQKVCLLSLGLLVKLQLNQSTCVENLHCLSASLGVLTMLYDTPIFH